MLTSPDPPIGVLPPEPSDPRHLGPFRLVGRLGAGGMGVVYAGLDDRDRKVAVKCVHRSHTADGEFRARFAREVNLVRRVRAAGVPAFRGANTRAEVPWLATEYVPGPTLDHHLREHGPLTEDALDAFSVGVAETLAAVHAQGVVHRDLKPGNVILSPDGPKVLDFGIARAADGTVLTATGGLHGTPGWVAPERYEGADATGYTDMFAWGGLLAYAATGRDPFGSGAMDGIIHRSRHEEPDLEGVPEPLLGLVRRALAKDPGERPHADEALAELTRGWSATRVMPGGALPSTREPEAGRDPNPTGIVPELLAAEWRGVAEPETRRVRRASRPLLLSAAAAVLVVVLVGGLVLSDLTPWGNGTADGEEETVTEEEAPGPVVQGDPEDGVAVAAEAIELLAEAPDLLYRHDLVGDPTQTHSAARVLEYTEDPVPVYRQRTYEPAGVAVRLRYGDDLEEGTLGLIGIGQEVPDTVYYRGEGSTLREELEAWEPAEDLAWGLELILEPGAEIEYQGRSRVPYLQEFTDGGVSVGVSFEETEGHHYSGSVRAPDRPEGEEGDPMTFDLWIDDEGRPLRFYGSTVLDFADADVTMTRDYDYREQDIHIPDEPEILPDRPEPGA